MPRKMNETSYPRSSLENGTVPLGNVHGIRLFRTRRCRQKHLQSWVVWGLRYTLV